MVSEKTLQTNSLKQSLNLKLKEINLILRDQYQHEENIGTAVGLSGISLFQFHYAKYTNNDTYADWGQDTLFRIIELINKGYGDPKFSSGLAGAGWLFDYLQTENFIELDNDELLSQIDNYILISMKKDIEDNDYDFLHGALGYAIYYLNRYKYTQNDDLKIKYKSHLDYFISNIEKTSIKTKHGIKWLSKIKSGNIQLEGCNLSLSHGMSSIVTFLCDISTIKAFKNRCIPLINESINYLLSNEFSKNKEYKSLFPSWILENGTNGEDSRLAWCYGDFGIGLTTLKASKVLNSDSIKQKADYILKHTTNRKTKNDTKVIDASICHGAFGNAQIYNSLYKITGSDIYKTAATQWINTGLEMDTYKDGFAGYKQWYGEPYGWQPNTSLLEGIAGIGLSIIDYLSEDNNTWDKCLLIS